MNATEFEQRYRGDMTAEEWARFKTPLAVDEVTFPKRPRPVVEYLLSYQRDVERDLERTPNDPHLLSELAQTKTALAAHGHQPTKD